MVDGRLASDQRTGVGRREPQPLLVLRLAARSLWAHRVKSAIVGSLMTFGTLLVVSGTFARQH